MGAYQSSHESHRAAQESNEHHVPAGQRSLWQRFCVRRAELTATARDVVKEGLATHGLNALHASKHAPDRP